MVNHRIKVLLVTLGLMLIFGFAIAAHAPEVRAQDEQTFSRWDGQSRFTVLFLGMDRRPGARDNLNSRTDAIMLMSFDPATQSIGVIHIPRDLHVAALDTDPLVRVNTLMLRGEDIQEGYGPYYTMDTLQYNLGIYIDAYVAFDFEAVINFVDTLGGVEIYNPALIDDPTYPDMNYGFDPFYLSAGNHLLDGRTALKFARTRHGDNDYLRGQRQMEVIRAIGEKATSTEMLPRLITNAPVMLEQLKGHIYTDLTLEEAIPLAIYAAQIPLDQFKTGSLSGRYIENFNQEGLTVAIPKRTTLEELLREVFGDDYAG